MPDLVAPHYGERSLAEVLPALLGALGAASAGGDGAGALVIPPVRAAGLLLVDGLGAAQLSRYAADAPFLAGLPDAGPLTAGFPSSTATSLTSLGTGIPPGAHGMVGITMRVGSPRRPTLLHTLHWTDARTNPPVDLREPFPPEGIQAGPTIFERAASTATGTCLTATWM